MAITYAALQTRVQGYLGRSSLSVTALITQAENELNRKLNGIAALEAVTNFTLSSGASTVTLATIHASLNKLIRVWRLPSGSDRFEIPYLTQEQMLNQASSSTGAPEYYTVQGGRTLQFDKTSDQAYTDLYAHHTTKLDISTDESTNWIALNHEELYVFATLTQAEPYIKNEKRMPLWFQWKEDIIEQVLKADREQRGAQNAMLVPDITRYVGTSRYDVYSG